MVFGGERDLFFDWASVTKAAFAVAFARSGMDRREMLGSSRSALRGLGESRGTAAEDATLEACLAHRAGFPAHLDLFTSHAQTCACEELGSRREHARYVSEQLAIACRSRTASRAPLYSDVGYLLAGRAVAGDDVDDFIARHVDLGDASREMGSARQLALPRERFAPTEHVAWRGGEIRGHVHDENAWAISGDAASAHAGLFGTIRALLAFGVFAMRAAREHPWLVAPREGSPPSTLRAGFDGKSAIDSSAGTVLGPNTFGHLGFTGTSVWIDPDARVVVALLTNRVCPTRDNVRIRAARPRVHDELALLARASRAP